MAKRILKVLRASFYRRRNTLRVLDGPTVVKANGLCPWTASRNVRWWP